MKKLLLTLVLSLTTLLSPVAANNNGSDKHNAQHAAFHWIVMSNEASPSLMSDLSIAGCTAYAIAPHVLLTAQHCDLDDAKVYVDPGMVAGDDGERIVIGTPVFIAEKVYDQHDHMLLVLPTVTFANTVKYKPKKYRPAVQGERVFFWGNPQWYHDMYRQGYMMGIVIPKESDVDAAAAGTPVYIFDLNGNHGDSGAAIFSDVDGRIVSVVTYGLQNGKFIGGYLLSFTNQQVKDAEKISCKTIACPVK